MCLCASGWSVTGTADPSQCSIQGWRSVPPGVDTATKAGCQSCCSAAVTQGMPVFLYLLTQVNITQAAPSGLHSLLFFPLEENSLVFSCFFPLSFFFKKNSNIATTLLLQTLISVILCAADTLIPTAEPRKYLKCYWRTVPPSSVCLCSILPSTVVYTTNACEDLSQYFLKDYRYLYNEFIRKHSKDSLWSKNKKIKEFKTGMKKSHFT